MCPENLTGNNTCRTGWELLLHVAKLSLDLTLNVSAASRAGADFNLYPRQLHNYVGRSPNTRAYRQNFVQILDVEQRRPCATI